MQYSRCGCDKDIVSTVGTPDNRAWGLFDNRESLVPTALNHCFDLAYPGMNSGAIRSYVPPVLGAIIYGISPALGFMAVLFFEIPFG